MTLDRIMLIIGILMVIGSFAWMVWDLRRRSRRRRREYEAWLEEMHREIGEDRE